MMRSLWAGVSGLQAHQIAMDVEGHNIANVNTVGYKYSRVSFSDQISQTSKTATAPQGDRGGKNPMQVGLGAQVDATTRIFKTGSLEATDKNTDLAIENDGFFVVSPDGGKTYSYTRNGEFTLDANGNFINTQGYIVQGWVRDPKTNTIDSTTPIRDILIPPGMTTEAKQSAYVTIKANLNSGDSVGDTKRAISSLDSIHGQYGKGTIVTTDDEVHEEGSTTDYLFNSDEDIIENATDMGVMYNHKGSALNLRQNQGIWVSYNDSVYKSAQITSTAEQPVNFNLNGVNIQGTIGNDADAAAVPPINASTATKNAQDLATLINTYTKQTGVSAGINQNNEIVLTNDNRSGTLESTKNIHITAANTGTNSYGGLTAAPVSVVTAYRYQYVKSGSNSNTIDALDVTDTTPRTFTTTEDLRYELQLDAKKQGDFDGTLAATPDANDTVLAVEVDKRGQFKFTKINGDQDSKDINISISAYSNMETGKNAVSANQAFADVMKAADGKITQLNSFRNTQSFYMASLGASVDMYDSLGSKHTLSLEYTKIGTSPDNGTEWKVKISVPKPGVINDTGIGPENIVMGYVRFDKSGALSTYTPANISYTPNNGAAPNQNVKLNIGSVGGYDGLTSYDSKSTVSNIFADGYSGGDLKDIRVDETGTVIGEFTNGRSFGIARVALAKFTNNEGLESKGGNMFIQTSNSGDPIIGTANSGGRGGIKASNLEMSNVDLSRSLTQLIVVQRGFQANSKTITTSDQMLNTLLQLKQ